MNKQKTKTKAQSISIYETNIIVIHSTTINGAGTITLWEMWEKIKVHKHSIPFAERPCNFKEYLHSIGNKSYTKKD